jgi:uncharacterized membrane protein
MKNEITRINFVVSVLWAAAIIAAAILKAPAFLTIVLLPLLGFSSVMAVRTISRSANAAGSRLGS